MKINKILLVVLIASFNCSPKNVKKKAVVKKKAAVVSQANAINIYLINSARQKLKINWFDINNNALSSKTVKDTLSRQAISIPAKAISFTISNQQGQIPSAITQISAENIYQITCQTINNKCVNLSVNLQGPISTQFAHPATSSMATSTQTASSIASNKTPASSSSGVVAERMSTDGSSTWFSQSDYGTDDAYSQLLPDYSSSSSSSSSGASSNDSTAASTGDTSGSGDGSSSSGN